MEALCLNREAAKLPYFLLYSTASLRGAQYDRLRNAAKKWYFPQPPAPTSAPDLACMIDLGQIVLWFPSASFLL